MQVNQTNIMTNFTARLIIASQAHKSMIVKTFWHQAA